MLEQLEESKAAYDRLKEDEASLRTDLGRVSTELAGSATELTQLRETLTAKTTENNVMQQQVKENVDSSDMI